MKKSLLNSVSSQKLLPSQTYLRECFSYNPDTGLLIWLPRPKEHFPSSHGQLVFNGAMAGKTVGTLTDDGYLKVGINGTLYRCRRVIYKYWHGLEPNVVDHINHNRTDNRIKNLESVTLQENLNNRDQKKYTAAKKSGVVGINYSKSDDTWVVRKRVDGRSYYIGKRKCLDEAKEILRVFVP